MNFFTYNAGEWNVTETAAGSGANSVTNIDVGAFNDNQLTSINIPSSITVINASVFANNQLTSVLGFQKLDNADGFFIYNILYCCGYILN